MLSALANYYDLLAQRGEVLEDCVSQVDVKKLIFLNEDGSINEIVDYQREERVKNKKGKEKIKKVPRTLIFPKRTSKTAIDSNIVEHRPLYIFGFEFDSKKKEFTITDKAEKSHKAFVEKNLGFLADLDTPLANAYGNFIRSWRPEDHTDDTVFAELGGEFMTSNFVFCLSGRPDYLLNEEEEVRRKWKSQYAEADHGDAVWGQCGISGEVEEIARIHEKLKGIYGGQASGGVLVCFKNPAEESYGKSQSFNSNVSESIMRRYTEAFNYLTSKQNHRTYLDDMTILYWAQGKEDDECTNLFARSCFGRKLDQEDMDAVLSSAMERLVQGKSISQVLPEIDENVNFHVVGMTPNSSRISVKFFNKDSFGRIIENAVQHQRDLLIDDSGRQISVYDILRELKSPKSTKDKVSPPLISGIFKSILSGSNYPQQLLSTVVRRIKTDSDTETESFIKLNRTRVGVVKACLNRKFRLSGQKEEIKMALDQTNKSPAYLCGRLFAVLEKIQQAASNQSLNRTIKDAYFASACSTPAVIFPKLLKLSQNHLSKVDGFWNYRIGEITNELENEFPVHLSLAQQGEFILGYYQQFYYKKEKETEE